MAALFAYRCLVPAVPIRSTRGRIASMFVALFRVLMDACFDHTLVQCSTKETGAAPAKGRRPLSLWKALLTRTNFDAAQWVAKQGRKNAKVQQPGEERQGTNDRHNDTRCAAKSQQPPGNEKDARNDADNTASGRRHKSDKRIHL